MGDLAIRVLVVEDEPIYADQLEAYLQDLGCEFIGPATDARTTLSLFRTEAVDLVLLDVHLRGAVDGIELAGQLRELRPVPIIFLTSRADDEAFARARPLGPAAYLIKPVAFDALKRAMALAIDSFAATGAAVAAEATAPTAAQPPEKTPDTLFIKENGLLEKIRVSEIQSVEADNKVCRLVLAGRTVVVRMPLREVMRHLPPDRFVQIQRSYHINLDYLERFDPVRNLAQVGEQVLPVSQTYHHELLRRLYKLD
ncbi:LytR/AlgR family response regulator transcription factor [Hymenobacter properus]|uniref:Response regulator transcription factor n=1 Tax=Hymenobacter properus TaxID=2791026 RepID=A0A931BDA5_9BACT|nr:response regulator transcription factor [Hymenobacter properus]MBF9141714.1 response regulator transcription factor [Hymenobacter properus]MBR7720523.1 response regulator transcription factor [Microvirga sp. SRT04]